MLFISFVLDWSKVQPGWAWARPKIRKQTTPCDGQALNPTRLWSEPKDDGRPVRI